MADVKLAPSILSADFARIGEVVRETEEAGADYIHVDVMDGRFVPNLTIGPLVVDALRPHTSLPLDVHLMVVEAERLIPDFVAAGADKITVHQEAVTHLHRVVHQIRELGATEVALAVAQLPSTPDATLSEILPDLDLVLVMSVNPGFRRAGIHPKWAITPEASSGSAPRLTWPLASRTDWRSTAASIPDNVARVVRGRERHRRGPAVYNHRMTIAEAVAAMRGAILPDRACPISAPRHPPIPGRAQSL